jgi:hypothetical protein
MNTEQIEKHCRLVKPVTDRNGRVHFGEDPAILREVINLDRQMFLIRFDDGATTFVFPHELAQ